MSTTSQRRGSSRTSRIAGRRSRDPPWIKLRGRRSYWSWLTILSRMSPLTTFSKICPNMRIIINPGDVRCPVSLRKGMKAKGRRILRYREPLCWQKGNFKGRYCIWEGVYSPSKQSIRINDFIYESILKTKFQAFLVYFIFKLSLNFFLFLLVTYWKTFPKFF